LTVWEEIENAVPEVELHVFYGRNTWGILSELETNQLETDMSKFKSIVNRGSIGNEACAAEMFQCSVCTLDRSIIA
jgi:hypothetical protein